MFVTYKSIDGHGCALSGNTSQQLLNVTHKSTISNFTLSFGNGSLYGGAGLFSKGGTVKSSTFLGNTAAGNGGGVYFAGNGEVTECMFTSNRAAGNGGAVAFSGAATVAKSTFEANVAHKGGAVFVATGQLDLASCIFRRGQSATLGSAVFLTSKTNEEENMNAVLKKVTLEEVQTIHAEKKPSTHLNWFRITEDLRVLNNGSLTGVRESIFTGELVSELPCAHHFQTGAYSLASNCFATSSGVCQPLCKVVFFLPAFPLYEYFYLSSLTPFYHSVSALHSQGGAAPLGSYTCPLSSCDGNMVVSPGKDATTAMTCTGIECEPGFWAHQLANRSWRCEPCVTTGSYCNFAVTPSPMCPRGFRCPTPSEKVECLTPGTICRTDAYRVEAVDCPAGYFCPSPIAPPAPCQDNHLIYCPKKSSAVSTCPPGHLCLNASVAVKCPPSTYRVNETWCGPWQTCNRGNHIVKPGSSSQNQEWCVF